jgi:hypothetical protein
MEKMDQLAQGIQKLEAKGGKKSGGAVAIKQEDVVRTCLDVARGSVKVHSTSEFRAGHDRAAGERSTQASPTKKRGVVSDSVYHSRQRRSRRQERTKVWADGTETGFPRN